MAKTVQPRIDPMGGSGRPPIDDERELIETGTQGIPSNIAKQPILGSYLPVNPIQRYISILINDMRKIMDRFFVICT